MCVLKSQKGYVLEIKTYSACLNCSNDTNTLQFIEGGRVSVTVIDPTDLYIHSNIVHFIDVLRPYIH